MSKRKIKKVNKNKKVKLPTVSPKQMMLFQLEEKKSKRAKEEQLFVEDMIIEDKLDPFKINDYTYIKNLAKDLNWTTSRLVKAIKNTKVEEVLENENKEN